MIVRSHSLFAIFVVALAVIAVSPVSAASKTKADEEAGALLFRDQDCAHCHGIGGIGGAGKKGPALTNLRNNKLWPPDKIAKQIMNGGQKMPPFSDSLTDAQIAQLVAYLRAKNRPVPPPIASTDSAQPAH